MKDKQKTAGTAKEQLQGASGGGGAVPDCGVTEEKFPRNGKCCRQHSSLAGIDYQQLCPHCRIYTSIPTGCGLTVNHLFECDSHFYGKRI